MPELADVGELEGRFEAAMFEIYERAGHEVGYWAGRYLQLVRKRGGLGAARYLLAARVTSDGYARLRDAGRLDLTVEALVLQPEFAPLFSETEQQHARERLDQYHAMPTTKELEPSAEIIELVDEANAAPASKRIEFRDRIAAFGRPSVRAVLESLDRGGSPGLAIAVIETDGRRLDADLAVANLAGLRSRLAGWEGVIDQDDNADRFANLARDLRSDRFLAEHGLPAPPTELQIHTFTNVDRQKRVANSASLRFDADFGLPRPRVSKAALIGPGNKRPRKVCDPRVLC